jgi:RNA polymerase sigma-70 factor (ECF subfamily)
LADDLRGALQALIPRLRRFGLALTGSPVEADELLQGACERALQRSGQLRDAGRLDAWMFGIMRHLWIDELRARRIRHHEGMEAASDLVGQDGEALVESRMTLAAVRRSLAELSADHRMVLILVCVEGLSYRQAAEILGVALGTVMSRLSRARAELQEKLVDHRRRQAGPREESRNHGGSAAVIPLPSVNGNVRSH